MVGALDLERALTLARRRFEPGLLARANRGFLYIDEVNLLEDHLVDLLIDVAASGENVVEREGLSVRHPARFVLVGSGNPEEGELRPQLLDRFGLSVEVAHPRATSPAASTSCAAATRTTAIRQAFARALEPEDERAAPAHRGGTAAAARVSRCRMRRWTGGAAVHVAWHGRAARRTDAAPGAPVRWPAWTARTRGDDAHIDASPPSALRHRLRRDPLDEAGSTVARGARDG